MAIQKKTYKRKCENCNKDYIAKRPHSRFCSTACRAEFWRKTHPRLTPDELKQIKERLGIE
jgi:hypothetical protein